MQEQFIFKTEPFIVTLILTIVLSIAVSEFPNILYKTKFANSYSAVIDIKTKVGIDYAYWGVFHTPLELDTLTKRYEKKELIKAIKFQKDSVYIITAPDRDIDSQTIKFNFDVSDNYTMTINCKNTFQNKQLEPIICRE